MEVLEEQPVGRILDLSAKHAQQTQCINTAPRLRNAEGEPQS